MDVEKKIKDLQDIVNELGLMKESELEENKELLRQFFHKAGYLEDMVVRVRGRVYWS